MTVEILGGNCLEVLKTLESGSVNCCVTSPPYYGLRDYGTATWEGGDVNCDHISHDFVNSMHLNRNENESQANIENRAFYYKDKCEKCGAKRVDEQIGIEETPEEYVNKLVEVFREVKRVLKDDGTLWLNLGDSYAGSGKGRNADGSPNVIKGGKQGTNQGTIIGNLTKTGAIGCKPKDLIGTPWLIAFALRADGWYLRQDIIWSKPNPMPESVKDRCTKSHEYIFLFSKSPRYYFDSEAIKEPSKYPNDNRKARAHTKNKDKVSDLTARINPGSATYEKRNKRSVWTVTTKPFKGAHFATFPDDLIEPCILAGCPEYGTVLDPFGGSGTVGFVSERNARNSILIELNPTYIDIIKERTSTVNLMLCD